MTKRMGRNLLAAMATVALVAVGSGTTSLQAAEDDVVGQAEEALKDLSKLLETLSQALPEGKQVVASSLADAIKTAYGRAKPAGRPMPPAIAAELKPFFPTTPWLFERVRWVTLDEVGGLTDLVMLNPDVEAMTLNDVIVFRDKVNAETSRSTWAHELVHVLQYEALGVDGFAKEYLESGGEDFEKEAKDFADGVKKKLAIPKPKKVES